MKEKQTNRKITIKIVSNPSLDLLPMQNQNEKNETDCLIFHKFFSAILLRVAHVCVVRLLRVVCVRVALLSVMLLLKFSYGFWNLFKIYQELAALWPLPIPLPLTAIMADSSESGRPPAPPTPLGGGPPVSIPPTPTLPCGGLLLLLLPA